MKDDSKGIGNDDQGEVDESDKAKVKHNIVISIYNNVWFDNGLITLYNLLKSIDDDIGIGLQLKKDKVSFNISDINEFANQFLAELSSFYNNLIVIEKIDGNADIEKEVKKDFMILQEGKKIGGIVNFKEKFYNKDKRESFLNNLFKTLIKDGNTKNCIVCGIKYNGKGKSLRLKQSIYPLSTKIKSLSGVRSYKNDSYLKFSKAYYDNLCPLCYIIGVLNWANSGIIYRTFVSNKFSFIFLPKMDDLVDLRQFRKSYYGLLNNESRYSNIRVGADLWKTENTSGKFSTLLSFYEKFIFNTNLVPDCNEWLVMKIPLGNIKNVNAVDVDVKEKILGLLQKLNEEKIQIYNHFIKKVNFFKETSNDGQNVDWDTTNEIREWLSKSILNDDFYDFAHTLMPKKGGHIGYSSDARERLEKLIQEWRLKNMGIKKEDLEDIKKVGNIIAKTSGNAPTLLYKIDKARNYGDLLDGLRQVARKMAGLEKDEIKGKLSPMSLDNLIEILKTNEEDWKEIRNLLIIYSSMYYSIGKFKKRGE